MLVQWEGYWVVNRCKCLARLLVIAVFCHYATALTITTLQYVMHRLYEVQHVYYTRKNVSSTASALATARHVLTYE